MQRRTLLKNLAVTFGGMASLPAWASSWTPESIGSVAIVSVDEETLLGEIVETYIPETTTPGAKSLKIHQFALRMIRDCYDATAQTTLQQGLVLVDSSAQQAFNKAFTDCDKQQRLTVLSQLAASTDSIGKPFVDMTKKLTIWGYTNSEHYLVNVAKYTMAPGFYHGCVPVQKLAENGGR
ncbi:hypothetical protein GCM10028805_20370 [Spirosoma harenae]